MQKLSELAQTSPQQHRLIMVTGPYHGGKTTLLQAITPPPVTPLMVDDYLCYPANTTPEYEPCATLALAEDCSLSFLEWRGPRRSDLIEASLAKWLLGVVIVFDAHRPETFRETKSIMACQDHLKMVVVGNQFTPEAWNEDDLRSAFRSPQHLIAGDVSKFPFAAKVIHTLLDQHPDDEYCRRVRAALTPRKFDNMPVLG